MKVLFVCRGNVGRSQIAEAIFNKHAPVSLISISAGTKVINKDGTSAEGERLVNRYGAKDVLAVLHEIDIDAALATRKQVTEKMVQEADMVILMAEEETLPVYLKNNNKIVRWQVEDPKAKGLEETRKIRDQVNDLVKNLINGLSN